jgi:ATP-dependent protease ClpP protease subunit
MTQSKPVIIRFMAPIDGASIKQLLTTVEQRLKQGVDHFTLLISSPGGSVFHGLSAYNFLKGIPAQVTTHNFGSVDSIGVVLYCAGTRRYTVPHSRFLMHGVSANFVGNQRLEEKQIEERLKSMQIDIWNIANVIASTTGAPVEQVNAAILDRATLNAEDARGWGLVHEVRSELFEAGADLIAIDEAVMGMPGMPPVRPVAPVRK